MELNIYMDATYLTAAEIVSLVNDGTLPGEATLMRDEEGRIKFRWFKTTN